MPSSLFSYKKLSKKEAGREKIHPDDLDREADKKSGCRDVVFAILFVFQLVFMVVFGVVRGVPEILIASESGPMVESQDKHDEDENKSNSGAQVGVGLTLTVIFLSTLFSFLLFKAALKNPERLIKFGLYGSIALAAIMLIISAACASLIGSILWAIMLVLVILFVRAVRERVPFAAANLNAAVAAIKRYPHTGTVAGVALLFQAFWVLICVLAILGFALKNIRIRQENIPEGVHEYEMLAEDAVWDAHAYGSNKNLPAMNNDKDIKYYGLFPGCKNIFLMNHDGEENFWDDDDDYGIQHHPACACSMGKYVTEGVCNSTDFMNTEMRTYGIVYLLFILCVFWGGKVLAGVVHVTCAGSVAHWWFGDAAYAENPDDTKETVAKKPVVRSALSRALGPSFGSICFGSLLVAILSTLEVLVKATRDSCASEGNNGICNACLCCVDCLVNFIRDMMEYFNRWAFTYVAIYGDSFIASGKAVNALFKRRGWSSIISDTLCSTALFFATLLISVLVGICAALLALFLDAAVGKVAVVAVIGAYLMCSCFTSVLDAAVLTIIVCFAEDPHSGNENHPEEFSLIFTTWQGFYGDELEEAGYDRLF